MKFDDLDNKMRIYERSLDQVILPDMYMVARLDGRSFTKLTKETCKFEAPFDVRFRDLMVNTVKALMDCGFRVQYGYTQSDEISLLFTLGDNTFGRKVRKYDSILSGVASASFSAELGKIAVFDCRIIPLPNAERVRDYFLWRQEDAHRNSLNSWCYWILRKEGMPVEMATHFLEGRTTAFKNELLFKRDINYDTLPSWQKRGIGIFKEEYEKEGFNPITKKVEFATRNRLAVKYDLPIGSEYGDFIESFI